MAKEERKMILRMLEEGKITLEEADILIEALGFSETESDQEIFTEQETFTNEETKSFPGGPNTGSQAKDEASYDQFKEQMRGLKETISQSLYEAKKDLKKMQEEFERSPVGEGLGGFWSSIVDSLHTNFGSAYKFEDFFSGEFSTESLDEVEIKIRTSNGEIIVEPSLDDSYHLMIKSKVKAENTTKAKAKKEEKLRVLETDKGLEIDVKSTSISATIRLALPKKYLYNLNLDSNNGRIFASGLEANLLKAKSLNGAIIFKELKGQSFEADTSNGRLEMVGLEGRLLEGRTSNGSIYIDSWASSIKGYTSNGSITIKSRYLGDAEITARTSNGRVKISLPDEEDLGFMVRANTSMGSINLAMDNLDYLEQTNTHGRKSVVVTNKGWQEKANKVRIDAVTSMGSIHVGRESKEGLNI